MMLRPNGRTAFMAACITCGQALGFRQRLSGAKRCDSCGQKVKSAASTALTEYDSVLNDVLQAGKQAGPAISRLAQLETTITAGGETFEVRKLNAFRWFVDQALADEVLTAQEEEKLVEVGETLYRTTEALGEVLLPYRPQLFIAMVNDGRLPEVSSRMILKKGEVVHLEESAILLKEVVEREFQSGSRGVSFRIAKGVSYRVGSSRGRMVEVGRSLQPQDTGVLSVTSQRLVYAGTARSVEMNYAKLINLNVYTDALQVHVSNRQAPTTLRVTNGPMVAAAVNAAMQRLMN
jgi:hypothetical protein